MGPRPWHRYCPDRLPRAKLAAVTVARRILAFDQDEVPLKAAERLLSGAGLKVLPVHDLPQLTAQVTAFKPDLILLNLTAPSTAASEAIALLRDVRVPLVFVLEDLSERALVRAVQAHAVEVIHWPLGQDHLQPLVELLDELAKQPQQGGQTVSWEEQIAHNFMDLARRRKLHGTLMVNRGTPFEGRVV